MKLGVVLPFFGPEASRRAVASAATAAEDAGLDSVWVGDQTVIPFGYTSPYPSGGRGPSPQDTFFEALATLGFLAGCTERVALGTSVLVIAQRNVILTAKQCATVDVLSGGRTIFGVGVGWMREQFAALSTPFHDRGRRTDEQLAAFAQLWTCERASFAGEFVSFPEVSLQPRPVQRVAPLWIGGNGEAALARSARVGAAWHFAHLEPHDVARGAARLRTLAMAGGRDPDAIAITGLCVLDEREGETEATRAQRWLRRLVDYRANGVEHLVVRLGSSTVGDGGMACLRRLMPDLAGAAHDH